MKKSKRAQGFTLIEIMIVVAIIGLLAAIAVPNFIQSRTTTQRNACINNLRQVDSAKEQWALENNATTGDAVVDTDIDDYIKGGVDAAGASVIQTRLFCPQDTARVFASSYTVNAIGTNPVCQQDGVTHVLP